MKALFQWIDDRTGIAKLTKEALFENIPGGARWRYVWGSTLTFAIVVQFITGIMLWMFYSPSTTTAWESVYYIQNELPGGALLRGIHHWTAQIMIVLLVLHLVQVVVDGAYKAPREFNFWFGLGLLGITMALGLTGYLLPWDQKGFWATEVATNIVANTPVIGDDLKRLAIGGNEYGHHTLTRFFALHAGILPAALIGLIVIHIYLFRKHGITPAPPKTAASTRHFWHVALVILMFTIAMLVWNWQWVPNPMGIVIGILFFLTLIRVIYLHAKRGQLEDEDSKKPRRGDDYFWPSQIFRDAIACAAVMGGILFLIWMSPTTLSAPADPSENFSAARPDWYFMSLFYLLSIEGVDILLGAFIIPGIIGFVVFIMPFLGKSRVGHGLNLTVLTAILVLFVVGTVLAYRKDWLSEDFKIAVDAANRDADRIAELAQAPDGIPPEGALALLRKDPYTQGPKLFAKNCASCHRYDGHDGTGKEPVDEQIASDLKGFGDRKWTAAMLDAESFAHPDYFGATSLIKDSKMLKHLENADWDEDELKEVEKIGIALSAEAQLPLQAALDERDQEIIEEGRELLIDEYFGCIDCHKFYDEGSSKAPDLTGYASRQWSIDFIKNPEHKRFYGDRNEMPTFGAKTDENGKVTRPAQLTDEAIGMIVDWIRSDYYKSGK